MDKKEHPDFKREKENLDYTEKYLDKTINALDIYRKKMRSNVQQSMEEHDVRDASQGFTDILLNSQFLDSAVRNYELYKKAKNKPYFARIDYKDDENKDAETFYIGKTSLLRLEDNKPLIVDWRAPIASIYYEGRLGRVSYSTDSDSFDGELLLKRQFTIEKGELENIFDVDITTNDELLQESLSASAEKRLKDIATTIQAEQNRVIRAKINLPLIVQGVAGSGKTTIALHRIAYFIYTYENTFDPDNFMIIAPNKLFINYISNVLPELGVEKVKQTTYTEFLTELLGKEYDIQDPNEKINIFLKNKDPEYVSHLKWTSEFKGSLAFKDIIDNYAYNLINSTIPDDDFKLNDMVLMPNKDIKKMFKVDLAYLPVYKRIKELRKSLVNKLKYVKKEYVKNIEKSYDDKLDNIRESKMDEASKHNTLISTMDERDKNIKKAQNLVKNLVSKYIKKFKTLDLDDMYYEIVTNPKTIQKFSLEELPLDELNFFCEYSKKILDSGMVEFEDYAPMCYLKHKIVGFDKKLNIKNIVIDEAQDFSLFQIYTLKSVLNTRMFTLLGDLSQGIYSYRGVKSWDDVINEVFDGRDISYMTLVQSYRTTIEITNLANELIKKLNNKDLILAKPVIRHGEKPSYFKFTKREQLLGRLSEKIKDALNDNYKSIAVICKTDTDCKIVKDYLDKFTDLKSSCINKDENNYNAGIIVLTSSIAKGLEFDSVFIVTVDEKYTIDELNIKLLYVCMTRALHKLSIFEMNNNIEILHKIDTISELTMQN